MPFFSKKYMFLVSKNMCKQCLPDLLGVEGGKAICCAIGGRRKSGTKITFKKTLRQYR